MPPFGFSASVLYTAHQIDQLKQQIETADPKERPHLQRQLKELQILQLWQLSQAENKGDDPR